MAENSYYLAFSNFSGIGPVKFKLLLEYFGSAENAWDASKSDKQEVIGNKLSEDFEKFKSTFSIEDYVKKLQQKNVKFIAQNDPQYPQLLKQISNPPIGLYIKGNVELLRHPEQSEGSKKDSSPSAQNDDMLIAVVGTRKITNYGRQVTELLVSDLVLQNFIIVSGLAIGVDAIAHASTVENGGKTIAVLGCGVDCCYPSSNQAIYNSILEHDGLIVSEFPLSQSPQPGSFPSRNRIIAGLSLAVLVTEGAADSGSLITAELALKFNRKVFAIPGPITSSLSVGPYKLLKDGAVLVSSANEIIKELGGQETESTTGIKSIKGITSNDPKEQKVIDLLQNEAMHFDDIVRSIGMSSNEVGSLLTLMEIKGMVKSLEGGSYSLVN